MDKRGKKILRIVLCDILAIGVGLVVFSYFHHGRMQEVEPVKLEKPQTEVPVLQTTPEPAAESSVPGSEPEQKPEQGQIPDAEPSAVPTGLLQGKYQDKFSEEPVFGENYYKSRNISIELEQKDYFGAVVHVADVYLNDIECYRTAVYDQYSKRYMSTLDMANAAGAIVAISGDHFYAHRNAGVFSVRNGMMYANNPNRNQDICVLYYDGTMETYGAAEYDVEDICSKGPYQVWYFGPLLLDGDGKAIPSFQSTVADVNPRSAIGYYEPGHYCLLMVEGRSKDSEGVTLTQLSSIFEDLGCKAAYNLDGGKTASIVFNGQQWSKLLGNGRVVSDIVCIAEKEGQQ